MINRYIIFGIIIFLLSLGISLFFIFNHSHTPPPKPKPTATPVPPSQCEGDLLPCGSGCYDKKTHACSIDNKICNLYQFNPLTKTCCNDNEQIYQMTSLDSKGNKKIDGYTCCTPDNWAPENNVCCPIKSCNGYCCTDNKFCHHELSINPCVDCPTKLCPDMDGGKCCQTNEICYDGPSGATGINSQICCDPKFWDSKQRICCDKTMPNCFPDENICGNTTCNLQQTCINKETCCNNIYDSKGKVYSCINESGDDMCCPTTSSEFNTKCNLLESGKYLCCNDGHKFNKDTQLCGTICGNTTCDPNTQTAIFPPNSDCYCINKECEWGDYKYSPPLLTDKYNNTIDVCSIKDNLGYKYYTVKDPIGTDIDITKMSRIAETKESDLKDLCDTNDCIYRLSEKDMDINSYLNGTCTGHSDCNILLPSIKNLPDCKYDTNISSCCYQNGKYTGQICLDNQTCYSGTDTDYIKKGDCICSNDNDDPITKNCKFFSRNKYCNGHGDPDFNTGKCVCDPNYLESSNCKDYNPCLNGGTWDGHQCHCQAGLFAGSNCQYCRNAGDKCIKNCSGNGIPQDDGSCICDPNVVGNNCEITRANRCSSKGNPDYAQTANPDGTTVIDKTHTYCKCDGGYTGNNCEYPSNICEPGIAVDLGALGGGSSWTCGCYSSGGIYYNNKPPFCKPQMNCQTWCLQNFPANEYPQCIASCHM